MFKLLEVPLALVSVIAPTIVEGQCPPQVPSNANEVGYWDCLEPWSETAIHAILLHTGKVLAFSSNSYLLYDPVTKTCAGPSGAGAPCDTASFPLPAGNLFCTSHVKLADGRLLFYSGQSAASRQTTIYTPDAGAGTWTWFESSDAGDRFYPTLTLLASGKALLNGGGHDHLKTDGPCIFTLNAVEPEESTWDCLCNALWCGSGSSCLPPPGCAAVSRPTFNIDAYPFMFQLASGRVLYSGEEDPSDVSVKTKELETSVEGAWLDTLPVHDPKHDQHAPVWRDWKAEPRWAGRTGSVCEPSMNAVIQARFNGWRAMQSKKPKPQESLDIPSDPL